MMNLINDIMTFFNLETTKQLFGLVMICIGMGAYLGFGISSLIGKEDVFVKESVGIIFSIIFIIGLFLL